MPSIYRIVTNYRTPFSSINTTAEAPLSCRKLDLYRCLITVGNPSFFSWADIRQHGIGRALYDSLLEKIALVAINIESDRAGLRRHPIFESYITDKKRIVTYNLGMAFAKYYSERILSIPTLIHLEFLKKQGAVTFAPQPADRRPKEPDLVGKTPDGNWHLFEAKGVSRSPSDLNGKITEAKTQIRQVIAIHGAAPATGSACATYVGSDRILTYLQDPEGEEGKRIDIDEEKFYDAYYSPFALVKDAAQLPSRRERLDGLDVEFYDLEQAARRLSVGLEGEVAEQLRVKNYQLLEEATGKLRRYSEQDNERYSIGLDGFVVSYTDR